MKKSIGFIGAGRITYIFLQALKNKNIQLNKVSIYDVNNDALEKLKDKFSEINSSDLESVSRKEIVIIALHPPVIIETLNKIKGFTNKDTVFISLAPKITIEKLASNLDSTNIARLIPNATSFINEGYNPVSFSKEFSNKNEIISFLSNLGKTFETEEQKLESYAIVSAMLPTYFWFQWFEMIDIAKQIGLTETESKETIEQTLLAAINTAFKAGLERNEIIDLIPVKPIFESEEPIKEVLRSKLMALYNKIKP